MLSDVSVSNKAGQKFGGPTRARLSCISAQQQENGTPDVLDKSASLTAPPPTTVTRSESTVPRHLQKYLSLDDFEPTARRRISKFLYGYISGGAETDAALRDNRDAFDEYGFVPRVLKDVSGRDQTTTLFGKTYASPFGIPPMGSSALCAYRGDIVLTQAAKAENVPMILSASSLITLEDVRAATPDGLAIAVFGLLSLIATPVAGVAVATVWFWQQRERPYALISAVVLAMLLLSLVLAGGA